MKLRYFVRAEKFISDESINQLRIDFRRKDELEHNIMHKYVEEEETLYYKFGDINEEGKPFQNKGSRSFEDHVSGLFEEIASTEFRAMISFYKSISNDELGEIFKNQIKTEMEGVQLQYSKSSEAAKYPKLYLIIERIVKRIEKIMIINIRSVKVERRGSHRLRQGRIFTSEVLLRFIDKANNLMNENPDEFMPKREGAIISLALGEALEELPLYKASTIMDNFRKKTVREERQYRLKNDNSF